MRIIAGTRKGLRLEGPHGKATRPTSDRARESLFNILTNGAYGTCLQGRAVADFFAGTGAVGLEAISRGASHCNFFETDSHAVKSLIANIQKGRFDAQATLYNQDALTPPKAGEGCGMIFLDPPYRMDVAEKALVGMQQQGWLAEDGLAIVQLHPKAAFAVPLGFSLVDERCYGAARFLLLEHIL